MTTGQGHESHLFTLRLWGESDEEGRIQWRGKLHHVLSGQTRHFRDWPALIPLLLTMLPKEGLPKESLPMDGLPVDGLAGEEPSLPPFEAESR